MQEKWYVVVWNSEKTGNFVASDVERHDSWTWDHRTADSERPVLRRETKDGFRSFKRLQSGPYGDRRQAYSIKADLAAAAATTGTTAYVVHRR